MSEANNQVAALIANLPGVNYDYNYIYSQNGPNMYTIFRRTSNEPFKSFPIMQIMFGEKLSFIDSETMIKNICELYSKIEYNTKEKDNTKKHII